MCIMSHISSFPICFILINTEVLFCFRLQSWSMTQKRARSFLFSDTTDTKTDLWDHLSFIRFSRSFILLRIRKVRTALTVGAWMASMVSRNYYFCVVLQCSPTECRFSSRKRSVQWRLVADVHLSLASIELPSLCDPRRILQQCVLLQRWSAD
jgi:hypothetical protein